jgi:hypothetical protein
VRFYRCFLLSASALALLLPGRAQLALDQSQTAHDGGMAVHPYLSEKFCVWQSFTAGTSGRLRQLDMGFSGDISGTAELRLLAGEGLDGQLLESLVVSVESVSQATPCWNSWDVSVPSVAGNVYTFVIVANEKTMPDPFYVCLGMGDRYRRGALGLYDWSGRHWTDNDMCFQTWVSPVPEPSGVAAVLAAGLGPLLVIRRRRG